MYYTPIYGSGSNNSIPGRTYDINSQVYQYTGGKLVLGILLPSEARHSKVGVFEEDMKPAKKLNYFFVVNPLFCDAAEAKLRLKN